MRKVLISSRLATAQLPSSFSYVGNTEVLNNRLTLYYNKLFMSIKSVDFIKKQIKKWCGLSKIDKDSFAMIGGMK